MTKPIRPLLPVFDPQVQGCRTPSGAAQPTWPVHRCCNNALCPPSHSALQHFLPVVRSPPRAVSRAFVLCKEANGCHGCGTCWTRGGPVFRLPTCPIGRRAQQSSGRKQIARPFKGGYVSRETLMSGLRSSPPGLGIPAPGAGGNVFLLRVHCSSSGCFRSEYVRQRLLASWSSGTRGDYLQALLLGRRPVE